MTAIEKAARALCAVGVSTDNPEATRVIVDALWPEYVEGARAVLMAVREPGPALMEVGRSCGQDGLGPDHEDISCGHASDPSVDRLSAYGAGEVFTAMIDAILSGEASA